VGGKNIYTLSDLKKSSAVARFRFDPKKQEIAKQWNELRRVDQASCIDLSDPADILEKFKQVENLIVAAFLEDRSTKSIKYWLNDICIAFGSTSDTLSRNIWLDLKVCYLLLRKEDLIKK
jgi:hypothetical protein